MRFVKSILKFILLVAGIMMLVGGGICAAIDVLLAPQYFRDAMQLFVIAATVAGVGLLLIWLATRRDTDPDQAAGMDRIENDQ